MPTQSQRRIGLGVTQAVIVSVLLVSGATKAMELLDNGRFLLLPDPVFSGIRMSQVWLVAILAEFGTAAVFLFSRQPRVKAILCLWLASCFALYHILLAAYNPGAPCRCLGHFLSGFGVSDRSGTILARAFVGFMFAAGLGLLAVSRRRKPDTPEGLTQVSGIE